MRVRSRRRIFSRGFSVVAGAIPPRRGECSPTPTPQARTAPMFARKAENCAPDEVLKKSRASAPLSKQSGRCSDEELVWCQPCLPRQSAASSRHRRESRGTHRQALSLRAAAPRGAMGCARRAVPGPATPLAMLPRGGMAPRHELPNEHKRGRDCATGRVLGAGSVCVAAFPAPPSKRRVAAATHGCAPATPSRFRRGAEQSERQAVAHDARCSIEPRGRRNRPTPACQLGG